MEVRLARHGRNVAIVTIDNQRRLNALTRAMLTKLGRLCDELECDGSCRAIVLTGAGTRAFTVGADIAGDPVGGAGDRAQGQPCAAQDRRLCQANYRGVQRRYVGGVTSWIWPGEISMPIGRPSALVRALILVKKPPRERPSALRALSPLHRRRSDVRG
jgi:hypothetical protein